jgi:hypothetical protein
MDAPSISNGSSLQRAVMTGSVSKKVGTFEACFAGGLDLSEFATSSTSSASVQLSSSHAASLLRIKQAESVMKLENEKEEAELQNIIRERADNLKLATGAKRNHALPLQATPPIPTSMMRGQCTSTLEIVHTGGPKNANSFINSLVIGMHGAERSEEPRQKLSKRVKSKIISGRRSSKPNPTTKPVKASKKLMRSKY